MKVGEEMDKKVAERFLGWVEQDDYYCGCTHKDPNGGWYSVPEFSTDISAAWQIMEKLSEEHDQVDVFYDFGAWFCYTSDHKGTKWVYNRSVVGVETAAEAICRCALVTTGMDPDEI